MTDLPMTTSVEKVMSERVVTVDATSSAYDAAREIIDRDIGCVVVLKDRKIVGILTKGDILKEAVMKRLDPITVNVERIMSHPVLTIKLNSTLAEASALMSEENLTKLPVVDKAGELVGIITSSDIMRRNQPKRLAKDTI
ncbi:MAG: CBS domain-containing protein [Nitrososphaerota archaeon]|nr:CBS domain-containing protein [Nitrososphaerota archaeon]